jgi:small ligand-binding sensory domain FIST
MDVATFTYRPDAGWSAPAFPDWDSPATLDALPPGMHQAGFYSYGEISPYAPGRCDLHNQTMTLTMLHER